MFSVTELITPVTAALRASANGGGGTIFVGDGGTILKATLKATRVGDNYVFSTEFSQESSGITSDLHSVMAVPGSLDLIAVGDNGKILVRNNTSEAWSSRISGTTENLISFAQLTDGFDYSQIYVIVGENGGALTSTDLTTWTAGQKLNPPGKIGSFNATTSTATYVTGESGYFASAGYRNRVVTFTESASLNQRFSYGQSARSITQGNEKYVIAGGNFSASSTDGESWETSQIPNSMAAVAYGAGKFVSVGGVGTDSARADRIWFSSDGLDWKKATMPALNRVLNSITYGSEKFIASGKSGAVMASEDGVTWTQLGGDLTATDTIVSLVHHNGIFVGVGGETTISSTNVGATFSKNAATGVSGLSSVTWGGGTFVAVGTNVYTLRSTNGTSWTNTQIQATQSATGSRPEFDQVVYASDNFIATTRSGQAYVSSDGGASWLEKFTTIRGRFTGSTVGNGLAVFINAGTIFGIAVNDNSPYVTTQPQPTTLSAGTPLNLSVTVSGGNSLTYQWFQNGVPMANGGSVSGANGATLTISNIDPSFSGKYQVTVTNPDGSRTSTEATVTVEGSAVVGFDAWKTGFTFPSGKDGPLDDADDDGVPNLLESVTGSSPVEPGPSLLPGVGKLTGAQIGGAATAGKTYLTFKARVRKDRPGITLIPQSASDLIGLTLAGASANVAQAGAAVDDPADSDFEFITYYHTVAMEDVPGGKAFMTLGASL